MAELLVSAPAKINLHLEVLGLRPDGFHELAIFGGTATFLVLAAVTFTERHAPQRRIAHVTLGEANRLDQGFKLIGKSLMRAKTFG